MSTDTKQNLVLRTVYLPRDIEAWLKRTAYSTETSKNDIIRQAVAYWLETKHAEHKPGSADK